MTNYIARFLFAAIFVIVSVGLVAWETTSLLAINKKGSDIASTTIRDDRFGEEPVLGNASEVAGSSAGIAMASVVTEDARPLLLKKYLTRYNSPLLPFSDLIFKLSKDYGYDYRWIVAIAQQESNLCKKIPENSFNCWGYGITSKGTLKFDNYELAIKSYAEYLKREYFDKGLNTPDSIMKKYCPPSNGSWAYGVKQFFDEIERG